MNRYEFNWIEHFIDGEGVETQQYNAFGIHGCSADVANGVCAGLQVVPSVTDVVVKHIAEVAEDVTRALPDISAPQPVPAKKG